MDLERVKTLLRPVADFPKKGILFQDIFPIFQDPSATQTLVLHLVDHIKKLDNVSAIIGLDSRGFLLGPWVASLLNIAFVPVRKAGKLPPPCHKVSYELEYGTDSFEISKLALKEGENVVILDDLIATGGSAQAAESLVKLCGGKVIESIFIVELTALNGKKKLSGNSYSIFKFDD